ncbi:hypothetical protein PACTADRAFT_50902 [Pachysolen tannophilus NRRL Y-2460]|uniref:PhoD-like phosphatase domain-containing protein n=1 Tax=Pachysolen tannophilus NRRL Y-2460 TaxID=669874 RepID=A0A1E4TTL2_PACTA|nr:hypothetical protein PACTADRAFT_50902 [Pachysolen tannophilus NRRL Y-2460]
MSLEVYETWFDPIPIENYLNRLEDLESSKFPHECPVSRPIGEPKLDIRCGPILRLLGTLENGSNNYRASLMLVTKDENSDYTQSPSVRYFVGPAKKDDIVTDEWNLRKGHFETVKFAQEQGYTFWRFKIFLGLEAYEQRVKYSINGVFKPDHQFFIPGAQQTMNVVSHSCNGFSLGADPSIYKGSLWLDVLRNHNAVPYHVMIGGGDQIYADAVKQTSIEFSKWLAHKKLHSNDPFTQNMKDSFEKFYLNHYLKWFGKGYWTGPKGGTQQKMFPIAMSQIPSINIYDDHDIIDGYGSYADSAMNQPIFKGVGEYAFKYYMLFQHQTSISEKSFMDEPSWILGDSDGPFIEKPSHSVYVRLGREIGFVGFDCRTERSKYKVIEDNTYELIFQRIQTEFDKSGGEIKHLLVLLGIPIAYPRLVWLEYLLNSSLLFPFKYLARKGIIAKGLVNEFDGSMEVLDDLDDHWCARHHKKERNKLVADLTRFGAQNGVRITILSGDVHLCCIGRFQTKMPHLHKKEESIKRLESPQDDPRLIFNVISSAIVNAPPPNAMAKLLNKRTRVHHFDKHTDEDIIPLFTKDVDGNHRDNTHFLNKRNWCDLIPIKNNPRYINSSHEVGEKIIPGPVSKPTKPPPKNVEKGKKAGVVAYPVEQNSLVVTLHVEKKPADLHSETADYELLVPPLRGTFQLKDIGVKK